MTPRLFPANPWNGLPLMPPVPIPSADALVLASSVEGLPNVTRWAEAMAARPAIQRATTF